MQVAAGSRAGGHVGSFGVRTSRYDAQALTRRPQLARITWQLLTTTYSHSELIYGLRELGFNGSHMKTVSWCGARNGSRTSLP